MFKSPGICLTRTTMFEDKRLFKRTAKFIGSLDGRVADMGCENAKSNYLSDYFGVKIEQIDCDFNFTSLPDKKYDIILCLEVLEHLQNPLFFMKNVKGMLAPKGTLYLSTPSRFRFLWTEKHFFEMSQRHLRKWILAPCSDYSSITPVYTKSDKIHGPIKCNGIMTECETINFMIHLICFINILQFVLVVIIFAITIEKRNKQK